MKRFERCFVTGCDSHTEWMLPWFLENYRRTTTVPIVFADFGVSPKVLKWCERHFDEILYNDTFAHDIEIMRGRRWYLKPMAIMATDANMKVWVDTDCEFVKTGDTLFGFLQRDVLNMVQDMPWSIRRGELWHNTGVVGTIGNPSILYEWSMACKVETGGYTIGRVERGDQDALHDLVGQDPLSRIASINNIPNRYNVLRIQLLDGYDMNDMNIVHWTGMKGKDIIKEKING